MGTQHRPLACALVLIALACSDTGPSLDLADVPEGWDEHRRRQNVTVRDPNGGTHELTPEEVAVHAGQACASQLAHLSGCNLSPSDSYKFANAPFEPSECSVAACGATFRICIAHRLMELAEHRQPEYELAGFTYPVLDVAERAAVHERALFAAREAVLQTGTALTSSLVHPQTCQTASSSQVEFEDVSPTGERVGTVLVDTFVEAFELMREAAERSYRNQLAVADGQRSLRRSDRAANTFSQLAPVLSRGAAAQLVTQAPYGFHPADDGFALPILGGKPLADTRLRDDRDELALQTLREAAVNPADLLDPTLPIDELVGGTLMDPTGTGFPSDNPSLPSTRQRGSVLERLEDLHGQELGNDAQDLYRNLGLTREHFLHARDYLRGEIRAFARNPTTTLPRRERATDAGTHLSQFTRYAATAARPVSLPAAYWSTLASASPEGGLPPSPELEEIAFRPSGPIYARTGLAASLDYAHSVATLLVAKVDSAETATHRDAYMTAARILNTVRDERPARLVAESRAPFAPGYPRMAHVRALAMEDDDLVLLRGLDGAQCAERGLIDGLPCNLDDYLVPRSHSGTVGFETGFSNFAQWNVAPFLPSEASAAGDPPREEVFFLGRHADALARAGGINLIGGIHFPSAPGDWSRQRPVNPWLDALAKDALEPSTRSPVDPSRTCTGLPRGMDLPLENELSDDGDLVESSWRTYLRQALIAADEADRLGDELVRAGLDIDIRAEQALETLEATCGTAIDLDALRVDSGAIDAPPCGTAADCGDGLVCHAGRCVMDPINGLLDSDRRHDDAELSRLRSCVDEGELVDFVSFGTDPLCLWVSRTNPNDVCNSSVNHPCPFKPSIYSQETCEGLAARIGLPSNQELRLVDRNIEAFRSRSEAAELPSTRANRPLVCAALRRLRVRHSIRDALILNTNRTFHPQALRDASAQITAFAKLDGHIEFSVGGQNFTTGDALTGTISSRWPCSNIGRPLTLEECESTPRSILCAPSINCSNRSQRTDFSERMLLAATVARSLAGVGYSGMVVPTDGQRASSCGTATAHSVGLNVVWERACNRHSLGRDRNATMPMMMFEVTGTTLAPWRGYESVAFFDIGSAGGTVSTAFSWGGIQLLPEARDVVPVVRNAVMNRYPESTLLSTRMRDARRIFDIGTPSEFGRPLNWDSANYGNLWDAVELICAADEPASDLAFGAGCGDAPVVRSLANLPQFRSYMGCLANDLRRRAEHMVVANVPEVVIGAIDDSSGGVGSYPGVGGIYGQSVASLRDGLRDLPLLSREVASHIDTFNEATSTVESQLRAYGIRDDILQLDLNSTISNQVTSCINATASAIGGPLKAAAATITIAATCINSGIQVLIAVNRRAAESMLLDEQRTQVIATFMASFSDSQLALSRTMTAIEKAQERIDNGLIGLESARRQASRAVARALFADSDAAGRQYRVSTVMRRRLNTLQERYEAARSTALRRAELARRAIELRLAVDLSSMVEPLALVDAPATWVDQLCEAEGINYRRLRDAGVAEESYAPAYVGDYVRRLDAVVESYRLAHPFTDGRDTAVVSLKNEIDPIFARCDHEGPNLLLNTLDMGTPGSAWTVRDCPELPSGIPGEPPAVRDCVGVGSAPVEVPPVPWPFGEADAPRPRAHRVVFGPRNGIARDDGLPLATEVAAGTVSPVSPTQSSLRHDIHTLQFSRLSQDVVLDPNRKYRLSWYERRIHGPEGAVYAPSADYTVNIIDFVGLRVPMMPVVTDEPVGGDGWVRRYMAFDTAYLDEPTLYEVTVGPFRDDTLEGEPLYSQAFDLAGVMLEDITRSVPAELCNPSFGCPGGAVQTEEVPPVAFWGTRETTANLGVPCEDTSGDIFRYRRAWTSGCEPACDPTTSTCPPQRCYRELSFELTNEQERSGQLFRGAGFAHGNYNYRVERIGFNVVGSAVQDCERSPLPTSCYASGFAGIDLRHTATTVLDHHGNTYPSGDSAVLPLTPGWVRGGRALVAERHLTNPLSGADRGLIEPYMRTEMRGRPLSGAYTLRIYEDDILFDAVEDIQIVIDYRYWTPLR
ncbi:MAG: hypothetical protein KF901_11835 [Myxococcales bacterium]|nr:hypothetical protein [Myxococcales bacterium]